MKWFITTTNDRCSYLYIRLMNDKITCSHESNMDKICCPKNCPLKVQK